MRACAWQSSLSLLITLRAPFFRFQTWLSAGVSWILDRFYLRRAAFGRFGMIVQGVLDQNHNDFWWMLPLGRGWIVSFPWIWGRRDPLKISLLARQCFGRCEQEFHPLYCSHWLCSRYSHQFWLPMSILCIHIWGKGPWHSSEVSPAPAFS